MLKFLSLPIKHQIGIWFGLMASIAIAVYGIKWSVTPSYLPLYHSLESKEIGQITNVLDEAQIAYQLNAGSGGILVPADKVHTLRMRLSAQGLPKRGPVGLEIMDDNKGFMGSHFAEFIRYRRGLEGELARTLSSLVSIRGARVHLGLAKESSFIKKQNISSASVVLDIVGDKPLDKDQIDGIVHLVASSVPGLTKESVSVVDQNGTLLNDTAQNTLVGNTHAFRYTQQVEQAYMKRIQNVLAPLFGKEGVHSQVTADMDFTAIDEVQEHFDPNSAVVRSEHRTSERKGKKTIGGIPGAMSNQPFFLQKNDAPAAQHIMPSTHLHDQSTRNFEVDKSITHIKRKAGRLSRLSVAVVVDENKTPSPAIDLEKIETIVKHAIGYQANRGDTVSVTYAKFVGYSLPDPIEVLPFYERPGFIHLLKPVVAGILGALFIVFILKPLLLRLLKVSLVSKEASSLSASPEGEALSSSAHLLASANPARISILMQKEHPQIQAAILSYLSPEQGAAVIAGMPEETRVDLMVRLATLSTISPTALQALNERLQTAFSGHSGSA